MSLLSRVRIASPCSARWSDMKGDERVRHCGSCGLDVFNLSNMTMQEAEDFLESTQALSRRPCLRFYRRADGTILTQDCPAPSGLSLSGNVPGPRLAALVALGLGVAATPRVLRPARNPAHDGPSNTITAPLRRLSPVPKNDRVAKELVRSNAPSQKPPQRNPPPPWNPPPAWNALSEDGDAPSQEPSEDDPGWTTGTDMTEDFYNR